ncbi:PfkB family carbohydrate kinase [Crossiella sp. SN42]|uniref:carbohydrate kinase family protein n=1 Tax=Crossiella sp. SN42 TaxID=2944808 RepID=UPI00207C9C81|nr:PfkB family carbohydrate kinase [Crossiella sp. SN42]MCO1575935.1 PfkB family carbohydrate kinase [Crossiella sp. SN42]
MTSPPETRYDVVVVGNATIDYTLRIGAALHPGHKQVAHELARAVGGEATNACLVMSALGLRTNFVGRFGADPDGEQHRRFLLDHGCAVEGSILVPGADHHFAAVVVDGNGERTIVTQKNPALTPDNTQLPPSLLRRCHAFFSDGREAEFSRYGLAAAKGLGVRTFADAEDADWLGAALADIDELIVPEHVAVRFAGTEVIEDAARKLLADGPEVVVVTLGARGSVVADADGRVEQVPAAPATVVDSTGAGDAFHGAYVAARIAGLAPAKAAVVGAVAGAATCEHVGPRAPGPEIARRCGPLLGLAEGGDPR